MVTKSLISDAGMGFNCCGFALFALTDTVRTWPLVVVAVVVVEEAEVVRDMLAVAKETCAQPGPEREKE